MLDALTPLDLDDLDLDLDDLDAALAHRPTRLPWPTDPEEEEASPPSPPPSPARARDGRSKPRRQAGEPLDPAALEAAKVGLPYFSQLHWICAQLLDKGEAPTRGHVRWRLKIEAAATQDLTACTRRGLQQMARVRWVMLSRPVAFVDNFDRKAKKFPLLHPARECRPVVDFLAEAARVSDAANGPLAPPSLLGFVSTRVQGTHTYGGQYALLCWRQDETGGWVPVAVLTQFCPGGRVGDWQERVVHLRVPPAVNRDGTPRASPFVFVGSWFSDALQARIDTAKAIKAMKVADAEQKAALAAKLRKAA